MNWQDLDIFNNLDNTQGLVLVGFLLGAFLIGIFTHWLFIRPRLRRLRRENRKLQKDLHLSQEKYRDLQEHYTVQEANLKRLNTEKKEQTQQLLLAENEQKQLAQRVEDQSTELRQYKRIKESAEAELEDFKAAYKDLESNKHHTEKQLADLQQQQQESENQVSEKEQQLVALKAEQGQLQEDLNLAKDSLQVTKEQLLDLQGHAAELEQQLKESQSVQSELQGQADELETAKQHIASLEAQLKVAQERLQPYMEAENQAATKAQEEQAQWDGALAMAEAALEKFGLYQAIPPSLLEESPEKIAAALKSDQEQSAQEEELPLKIDDELRFNISVEEAQDMQRYYKSASDTVFHHPFYAHHPPQEDQELLDVRQKASAEEEWEEEETYEQSFSEREEDQEAEKSTEQTEPPVPEEKEQDWSEERFERALQQANGLAKNSPLFGSIEEGELIEDKEEISRHLEEDEVYRKDQQSRSVQATSQEEPIEISQEESQHLDRSLQAMQFVMRDNPFFDEMDQESMREKLYDEERVNLDTIEQLDDAFEEKGQLSRALYAAEDLAQGSLLFKDVNEEDMIADQEQVSRNLQEDAEQQARSVGKPKVQLNESEQQHLQKRLQEAEFMLKGSPLFDEEAFDAEQYYSSQQEDLQRVNQISRRIDEEGAFYGKEVLAAHSLENSPLFSPIAEEELIEDEEQVSRSLQEDEHWLHTQPQSRSAASEQQEVSITEEELEQMQGRLRDLEQRWDELFEEKGLLAKDVYQENTINEEGIAAVGRGFVEEDALQKHLSEAEYQAANSLLFGSYSEAELVEDEQLLARRLAEEQPLAPQGRGAEHSSEPEISDEERNQLQQRLEQAAYYLTNSPLFGSLENMQGTLEQAEQPAYLTEAEERLQKALLQDIPPAQRETADDLKAINGIGPLIEKRLNDLGIYNYRQIAAFDENFTDLLAEVMGVSADTIRRDNWREQAKQLATN